MAIACTICGAFHGHNQEEHNARYEELIENLERRIIALEAK